MSTFVGLNNARLALAAQLHSMAVAGQNIANANTAGYSRQVAHHAAVALPGVGRAGNDAAASAGVRIAAIRRQYDAYLDARLRDLTADKHGIAAQYNVLTRLEELLREPGEATLGTALDDLWTAFAQLTTSPGSISSRQNVLHKAQNVVDSFRETATEMAALRTEVGERAAFSVQQVNALVQSLAEMNRSLACAAATGSGATAPNALLDERDALVRELAQFVQVHVAEQAHGAVKLTVGGRTLLEGDAAQQLKLAKDADGKLVLDLNAAAIADDLVGGALGGELQAHNRDLPQYQQQLDDFAFNVITQMNGLHSAGYDAQGNPGGDFFIGTSAGDIELAAGIKDQPDKLAMSASADGRDGVVAQQLADLQKKAWGDAPLLTAQYAAMITDLGSQVASLHVSRDANQALVDFAAARVNAVSGVNIDEELIDMVRYQQAYAAAARVLTSMDEALDVLINRTGLAGR